MEGLKWCLLLVAFAAFVELSASASIEKESFVVGGLPTEISQFPYSLAVIDLRHGRYICGASIIHRLWALTAAHCLDPTNTAGLYNLVGGSTTRRTGGHLFMVQSFTIHPQYNPQTVENDIAVMEANAQTPMEGFEHVTPIPIPPICNSLCCGSCPEGSEVTVAGWGAIDDGSFPDVLHKVDKPIMSQVQCRTYYQNIADSFFCTIIENGRDSCGGDSGSAAIRDGVQVGIVSFGSGVCGDGSSPAGYVRLENPTIRNFIAGFVTV